MKPIRFLKIKDLIPEHFFTVVSRTNQTGFEKKYKPAKVRIK